MAENEQAGRRLRRADLLGIVWRSFFLQASWSYDRMQSLGFAFALIPALRRLYPDRGEFSARLRAHMEYFNTQPYLASFVLGAAARKEECRALGACAADEPGEIKKTLMAPLGAVGDSFFWGSYKPFAAVLSVSLLLGGAWWAPILFLALFNAAHVGARFALLFAGYTMQGDVMALLARYPFTKLARLFKVLSLAVIGAMVGAIAAWDPLFRPAVQVSGAALTAAAIAAVAGGAALFRMGATPVKMMIGLAALCMALALGGI